MTTKILGDSSSARNAEGGQFGLHSKEERGTSAEQPSLEGENNLVEIEVGLGATTSQLEQQEVEAHGMIGNEG